MRTLIVHFPSGKESFDEDTFDFRHDLFKHTIEITRKDDATNRREINNVAYEVQHSPESST